MKRIAYSLGLILVSISLFGQDLTDALKFSNQRVSGTARSEAMGNAFGALGGDFSSLSINPAGAGIYRSNEFTFTTAVGKIGVDGTYLGNTVNDSKYNIDINNIGYIATIPVGQNSGSGLVSVSVGAGFNRLASFSMNRMAETPNANYSILGYFTENMNADYKYFYGNEGALDQYYERLAWDAYLINHDDNAKEYYNDLTDGNYHQLQRGSIGRKGYINEYLISLGANFNHKFYLGATIGIHDVYSTQTLNVFESDVNNRYEYFDDLNFKHYLKQTASGFNIKVGAIYKPIDNLRLGIAFHSPTFYRFNELYYSNMLSHNVNDKGIMGKQYAVPDQDGNYDYDIETPIRTILSGAYVIGKTGLISVDYEIVDYGTAKLKNGSDGWDYIPENKTISETYRTVGNLRVGGEYRLNSLVSLRAGYENYPTAFKSDYLNSKAKSYAYSGGFGFKQGSFFLDATWKRYFDEEYSKLYPGDINMAHYKSDKTNVIVTLGYKF